jgi:hypothetical protein
MNDTNSKQGINNFLSLYKWWFIAAFAIVFALFSISQYNGMVSDEEGILAEDKNTELAIASGYKKMETQGLASDKAFDLWTKAIGKASESRYGSDGIQAAITLIREDNTGLDMTVIAALQDAITVTFNRIESIQRAKVDKVRVYKVKLRGFPTSLYASVFGFPKIDMEQAESIVSSSEAKEMMESRELKTPDIK